jgi:guanylate kinase
MIEHKKVFQNYYGTSKINLIDILSRSKVPLLDIDVEGMLDVVRNVEEASTG